jgi:predicted nucleotidyltransferase
MSTATEPWDILRAKVSAHGYPLIFATLSGAHLYGFPSADSDYDLRGSHLLPLAELVGLDSGPDTIESTSVERGIEVDLVTHDLKKFVTLMLRNNGYVLEQLYSPLVVSTTPVHDELKSLASGCITKNHVRHYQGFASSQWNLFQKETPPRVKHLLYVLRVLLTGTWLMRTGRVEANLRVLNQEFNLPYVADLISRKTQGREQERLSGDEIDFFRGEFGRLSACLEDAYAKSRLRDEPSSRDELDRLVARTRLATRV